MKNRLNNLFIIVLLPIIAAQCSTTTATPPLPARPSQPILAVAILSPISGELGSVGQPMRNGIRLAFDERNKNGGVLDYQLEWVLYDTDCTLDTAQQVTQKAINDGHKFIIGPLCSEAAIGAATIAEKAGVVMIAPAATHPLVTVTAQGQTRRSVFRGSYSHQWQGQAAARFAKEVAKANKVAVLTQPGNSYSINLAQAFSQEFTTNGGDIVYQADYINEGSDFTDTLTAVDQAGVTLIYLPASPTVANKVARQLNELGLYHTDSSSNTGILLLGSDAWQRDQLALSDMPGSYIPVQYLANNKPWLETYKATYAGQPNELSALGYDAAHILAEAITQAGTMEPAAVITALEQNTFNTITGPITFEAQHNPLKPISFLSIKNGDTFHLSSIVP